MPRHAKSNAVKSKNVSTVRMTEERAKQFEEAIETMGFSSKADFFYKAALAVIHHASRQEHILLPLRFEVGVPRQNPEHPESSD